MEIDGEEVSTRLVEGMRSLADVEAAAQAAGVSRSVCPVQLLQFSETLNSEDVKLLELPQEVLSALQEGQRSAVMKTVGRKNQTVIKNELSFKNIYIKPIITGL